MESKQKYIETYGSHTKIYMKYMQIHTKYIWQSHISHIKCSPYCVMKNTNRGGGNLTSILNEFAH